MAKDKKSFVLYCDLIETVEQLSDKKAGELFKHILEYVNDRDPNTDDQVLNLVFIPIKQALKRDLKKYEKIVDRNRENGKKGGRPPNKTKPTGLFGNPKKPKKADNDTDTDTDNEIIIREELKRSTNYLTTVAKAHEMSLEGVTKALERFLLDPSEHKDLNDLKRHFTNWLNKNKPIKRRPLRLDELTPEQERKSRLGVVFYSDGSQG